jgi:hypothetical protein
MMKSKALVRMTLFAAIFVAAVVWTAPDAFAQARMRINGTAVGIGPRITGSRSFSLIVNSYTPSSQVAELNRALQADGQEGMLRMLSRLNAGRIQLGSGVGVRANAIIADPWGDRGTKLTILYERNIGFYERRAGTRSEDYKFGYAEIFLDGHGHGEGTLIPAAKVRLRGSNTWEVEDFGTFPARLMGLRSNGVIAR